MVGRNGTNDRWDAVIGRIGVVSHHLQSLLSAIKLTDCIHLYAKWDILMVIIEIL